MQMVFQDPFALAQSAPHASARSSREPLDVHGLGTARQRRARGRRAAAPRRAAPRSARAAIRTNSPAASASASASPARSPSSRSSSSPTSRSRRSTSRSRRRSSTCCADLRRRSACRCCSSATTSSVIRHVSRPHRRDVSRPHRRDRRRRRALGRAAASLHAGAPVRHAAARSAAAPRERIMLTASCPIPRNPPAGCAFHTRCPRVFERCSQERPALVPRADGDTIRTTACHLYPSA